MAAINLTLFISIIIYKCFRYAIADKRLMFVHVIYRHGDRNPGGTFPTDPYQEWYWAQGWSQLTKVGMQQHYELGQFFRQRYRGFLNSTYRREEIYVRSTDKDRTLQSAQCNLAGLYPAEGEQSWSSELRSWQPIPVHTVPVEEDILLDADANCPNYDKFFNDGTAATINEINSEYKDFFDFVKTNSGLQSLDVTSIGDVYSSLSREKDLGLLLPDWVISVYDKEKNLTAYDIIDKLKTISKNIQYNSPEKAKYRGGFLLGDILERIKEQTNENNNKKPTKMMMYSAKFFLRRVDNLMLYYVMYANLNNIYYSLKKYKPTKGMLYDEHLNRTCMPSRRASQHDDTVLSLMYALNVSNELIVPHAAALMIELNSDNNQFYVEIFYRNDTSRVPFQLTVPGCPEISCPLTTFEEILKDNVLNSADKRNEFCGVSQLFSDCSLSPTIVSSTYLVAMFIVLLIVNK